MDEKLAFLYVQIPALVFAALAIFSKKESFGKDYPLALFVKDETFLENHEKDINYLLTGQNIIILPLTIIINLMLMISKANLPGGWFFVAVISLFALYLVYILKYLSIGKKKYWDEKKWKFIYGYLPLLGSLFFISKGFIQLIWLN